MIAFRAWMFGCCILVCAHIAWASNIKIIEVPCSQATFNVDLKSNPSTGYDWELLIYDKELLQLKNTSFEPSHTQLMGAPGIKTFEFTLLKSQCSKSTTMFFKYARSFEPKSGTMQKVEVRFKKTLK